MKNRIAERRAAVALDDLMLQLRKAVAALVTDGDLRTQDALDWSCELSLIAVEDPMEAAIWCQEQCVARRHKITELTASQLIAAHNAGMVWQRLCEDRDNV